jgi:hypothetical protein
VGFGFGINHLAADSLQEQPKAANPMGGGSRFSSSIE